jgi:hypothetical protein
MSISRIEISKSLPKILKPGNFYSRNSIQKLLKSELKLEANLLDISKCLQIARINGHIKFTESNLWILNPAVISGPDELDNSDDLSSAKDIILSSAQETIVLALQKVTAKMAKQAITDAISVEYSDMVIKVTQEIVAEELRTELKPALFNYIDQKIKDILTSDKIEEIIKLSANSLKEQIKNTERRLLHIEKQLAGFGEIFNN